MTFVTCHAVTRALPSAREIKFFEESAKVDSSFPGEVMATKLRLLVGLVAVLVLAVSMVGCGHYTCGITFGSSTCGSGGGGGLGQGGGGNTIQNPAVFDYFVTLGGIRRSFRGYVE